MNNIYKRSLSGFVYVVLFTSSILYSKESYILLAYFFGLICLREFMRLIRLRNYIPYLLFSSLTFLLIFKRELIVGEAILLFFALSGSLQLLVQLFFTTTKYPRNSFTKFDITIRYLVFSLFFLMYLPFFEDNYKAYLVLSLVILIWTNDSFAYLVGKNFGKRPFFPSISPKKTVEGFVGGVFFTMLASVVLYRVVGELSLLNWLITGGITSLFGTFGDLVESKFKRQAKVKDSGHIMPGHGGLLDRLDSLLFVAPFVYLYIHYLI